GNDLVIAAYNGPRCHVLAGPAGVVGDLAKRLGEDGTPARLLDSPLALYSPAMTALVPPMRGVLREIPFRPPARRLISTITGAEVTEGDDLTALLATQLASPVLFARALGQVAAEADLLIEAGPGRQLSGLAADRTDVPAPPLAALAEGPPQTQGPPRQEVPPRQEGPPQAQGLPRPKGPPQAQGLPRPKDPPWREGPPQAQGQSRTAARPRTAGGPGKH